MTAPSLVTIVTSGDSPVDGTDTAAMLLAFSDALPSSDVWASASAEYGLGALTSVAHLTGPPIPPGTYPSAYFVTYLSALLYGDAGPAPDGSTIYLLYVPYGVTFGGDDPCGFHAAYPAVSTSRGDQMAIVRRCTRGPSESQLGRVTRTASHEVLESATDPLDRAYNLGVASATPWDGSVWPALQSGHFELGDLCEGTRIYDALDGGPDGGWQLERFWSNAAAADGGDPCAPPYDEPYYSVSTPQDWYGAAAGTGVAIPFTAWSAAPAQSWLLHSFVASTNDPLATFDLDDGGFALTSEAGVGTAAGCFVRYAANNGVGGSLLVNVPTTAASGDYFVFVIHSFREGPSCSQLQNADLYHAWPVGVFVP